MAEPELLLLLPLSPALALALEILDLCQSTVVGTALWKQKA